jgi:small GTP-binding protein
MIRKKILLLGDFSVGKTSLIRRYVEGSFSDSYLSTIGVKISKKCSKAENVEIEFIIWDIEGKTAFKKIPLSYYKGASAAIVVVDVNREETVEGIEAHKKIFFEINPKGKILVAYNKGDLLSALQKKDLVLDAQSFLTSAKENSNIELLFERLAKEVSQ